MSGASWWAQPTDKLTGFQSTRSDARVPRVPVSLLGARGIGKREGGFLPPLMFRKWLQPYGIVPQSVPLLHGLRLGDCPWSGLPVEPALRNEGQSAVNQQPVRVFGPLVLFRRVGAIGTSSLRKLHHLIADVGD